MRDHRVVRFPALHTGVDIEDDQLISFLFVEDPHCVDRIPDILVVLELPGLD